MFSYITFLTPLINLNLLYGWNLKVGLHTLELGIELQYLKNKACVFVFVKKSHKKAIGHC